MAESLKSKSILIADWGLFAELAPRLAREYGEVLYFVPWASAYPRAVGAHVGYGLHGVKRVATFWDRVPDVDVVMFPDIYMAAEQQVVRERFNKPVWGHGWAENLELDREGTRRLQKRLGIPAPRTRFFTGVKALEDHLQEVEDRYVKISAYRADMETFHHEDYHTSSVFLDWFCNRVGALQEDYEFLVEDSIPGIEIGFDGWTVHGRWPEACFWGIEVKDRAYVGKFSPYREIPAPVRFVNSKIAPVLAEERAAGFCSFEFRMGQDKVPYMIDPCLRCGSPPTEGTMEGYANLGEIVWEGAHGRMAEARPEGTYLAMAMIHSNFALTNWVPIACPPDVRRWLKLRNPVVLHGELYHAPVGGEMPEIGAVVGVGDTLEEAISLVRQRAPKIKGYQVDVMVDALDAAQEEVSKLEALGYEF